MDALIALCLYNLMQTFENVECKSSPVASNILSNSPKLSLVLASGYINTGVLVLILTFEMTATLTDIKNNKGMLQNKQIAVGLHKRFYNSMITSFYFLYKIRDFVMVSKLF